MSSGFIYAIGAEGNTLVKIGSTRASVKTRIKQLQIGIPYRLIEVASVAVQANLYRVEHQVHELVAQECTRLEGEWFSGTFDTHRFEAFVVKALTKIAEAEEVLQ